MSSENPEQTAPAPQESPFDGERASRDEAPQYVLPLVVRIERADPPGRTDALETAARAVLLMLDDARSRGSGEWAEAVRDWQDARIRKVVRRARGAEWRRAEALPGITVTGASAQVRVFPPVPLDGWPKDLARLQVSGTELSDPTDPTDPGVPAGTEAAGGAGSATGAGHSVGAEPDGPVLWLNPDLAMSAGKAMAQAGHGAQLAWWELSEEDRAQWRGTGFALAVHTAGAERWAGLTTSGLPLVRDAGFTEIAPGSPTVVADHPALRRRG